MPTRDDNLDTSGVSVRDMSAEEIDSILGELNATAAQFDEETADATAQTPPQVEPDKPATTAAPTPESEPGHDADSEAAEAGGPFAPGAIDEALNQAAQAMRELETAVGMAEPADKDETVRDNSETQARTTNGGPGDDTSTEPRDSAGDPPPPPAQKTDEQKPVPQATSSDSSPEAAAAAEQTVAGEPPTRPARWSRLHGLACRMARVPAAAAVTVLVVLDTPFARVAPGIKSMLGYVGIATLIVAIATWVLGGFSHPA